MPCRQAWPTAGRGSRSSARFWPATVNYTAAGGGKLLPLSERAALADSGHTRWRLVAVCGFDHISGLAGIVAGLMQEGPVEAVADALVTGPPGGYSGPLWPTASEQIRDKSLLARSLEAWSISVWPTAWLGWWRGWRCGPVSPDPTARPHRMVLWASPRGPGRWL